MQGNLIKDFILASAEFKKSKASEESINNLYDLVYELEKRDRNTDETVLLLEIYYLLGLHIEAYHVLQPVKELPKNEQVKFTKFLNRPHESYYHVYRDLREAKTLKEPTLLWQDDFSVSPMKDNGWYDIILKEKTHIVLLNKNVQVKNKKTQDLNIFSEQKPNENILKQLADYFLWIGDCKEELLSFYNSHEIEYGLVGDTDGPYKYAHADSKWFDGLDVWEVNVFIENDKIRSVIYITDYYHPVQMGFCLETKGLKIASIEYDPIL